MKYVNVRCGCEGRVISQNKHTRMKNGTVYTCKTCNEKIKFKNILTPEEKKIKQLKKEVKRLKKLLK